MLTRLTIDSRTSRVEHEASGDQRGAPAQVGAKLRLSPES